MNDVEKHYRKNLTAYKKVRERLSKIKSIFDGANMLRSKHMLIDSFVFAITSIQTPVPIHEDAWSGYMDNENLEEAYESVNYKFNKVSWIEYTSNLHFKTFEDILSTKDPDKLHKLILDNFKGVGVIKSAFTLAMLGFMGKICIDANVMNYFGLDKKEVYSGKVVSKYEKQCDELLSQIDLDVDPFMLQWILFNIERMSNGREFCEHTTYFNKMFEKYE